MTDLRPNMPRSIDYACGCGARLYQVRDGGEPNLWSMFCCEKHTPDDLSKMMEGSPKIT